MAKLETCKGCGVSFKHHELCLHRKVTNCGAQYHLRCQEIKDKLRREQLFKKAV